MARQTINATVRIDADLVRDCEKGSLNRFINDCIAEVRSVRDRSQRELRRILSDDEFITLMDSLDGLIAPPIGDTFRYSAVTLSARLEEQGADEGLIGKVRSLTAAQVDAVYVAAEECHSGDAE